MKQYMTDPDTWLLVPKGEMTNFEADVLELLEHWADDPLNITGLNSCDALLDLLDELRARAQRVKGK